MAALGTGMAHLEGRSMTSTTLAPRATENSGDALELLDREDLVKLVKSMLSNGVALTFHGKRSAMEISRRVRPRVIRRDPKLHVGTPEEQAKNLLIEGENLQAMVTLYKYRGQVDLLRQPGAHEGFRRGR